MASEVYVFIIVRSLIMWYGYEFEDLQVYIHKIQRISLILADVSLKRLY